MRTLFKSLAAAALAALAVEISAQAATVNYHVQRAVDVSDYAVREHSVVAFGSPDEDLTQYEFAVPLEMERAGQVAFVGAQEREDGYDLVVERGRADAKNHAQLYRVQLRNIVPRGERDTIALKVVLVNRHRPQPAEIGQFDRQYVELDTPLWLQSPYTTEKAKTTVQFPSADVRAFGEGELGDVKTTRKGNSVTYGPTAAAAPFAAQTVRLHYALDAPNMRVTRYEKQITISQWGDAVRIDEDFDLTNDVARLKAPYSRVDAMKRARYGGASPSTLAQIDFQLPTEAVHPYYRDEVGNVSTSHFRAGRGALLQVQPRFPLFGGWRFHWFQGYDVPLHAVAKKKRETGQIVVTLPLWDAAKRMHADAAVVRILLPEGAVRPRVYSTASFDKVREERAYSYLEGPLGRTVLVLEKRNLVDEHRVPLQIAYEYPTVEYLRKPLTVGATVFALLAVFALVSRVDFSI